MELRSGLPKPPPLAHDQSILLDFDGTLVELVSRPEATTVDPDLKTLLARLHHRFAGRIAIVSGRSIAQLQAMLGESARGLTLIGSHGAESLSASGDWHGPARPPALDDAARELTTRFADRDGVIIEEKSFGVAVHYRLAPAAEAEAHARVERFARRHGLAVQEGKMMVELRLPGHDKGTAIAEILGDPAFRGRKAFFLGDDLTDEPGFVATAESGGAGVLVGPLRATAAQYRLDGVASVRRWLQEGAA